jgi:hypothetical protein
LIGKYVNILNEENRVYDIFKEIRRCVYIYLRKFKEKCLGSVSIFVTEPLALRIQVPFSVQVRATMAEVFVVFLSPSK